MKVIELLAKIENGENPPKTIKINDNYYEYSGNAKNIYSYKEMDKKNKHCLEDGDLLNAEVEIIEEDKKIEKLGYSKLMVCPDLDSLKEHVNERYEEVRIKINKIIDILNKE